VPIVGHLTFPKKELNFVNVEYLKTKVRFLRVDVASAVRPSG
jgi:hypothetical protein